MACDPQQTTCCGIIYCKDCLERSSFCPTCRKRTSSFADHVSLRRIKALKVMCSNGEDGCAWTGKLDDLEDHLARCERAKVVCTNGCDDEVCRSDLEKHLESECSLRPHRCPHCNEEGTYEDITGEHLESICPMIEISCPNEGCEFREKQIIVGYHRASCPKERLQCEYEGIGCDEEVTRDTLKEHNEQYLQQHLKLAMEKAAVQQSNFQTPPRVFKMPYFKLHRESHGRWESPAFYSHPGGYKMIISVEINRNDYLSLYVHLVDGENDHNLIWPFRGKVTIELLNQVANNEHKCSDVRYVSSQQESYNKRPQNCPQSKTSGWGKRAFVGCNDSKFSQYHKGDCLYFRISKVHVNDANKPWLTPTDCPKVIH